MRSDAAMPRDVAGLINKPTTRTTSQAMLTSIGNKKAITALIAGPVAFLLGNQVHLPW
jgi:hypothetical protein